jgi:hypothetical protein
MERVLMFNETATDLAQACTELARKGKNFPTIWAAKLKRHALVEGIPRQRFVGTRSLLDIPLVTGDKLVFDEAVKQFNVE